MGYRNVVVGTDGSETAERAVRQAGELAASAKARLIVVTAYAPREKERFGVGEHEVPAELRWTLTDRVQADELAQRGRRIAKEAGAGEVVVQAIQAEPADAILEAASDFDADAIVVGSKGLAGAGRFLGSVASSVAHHAPCDVLIVHTV